MISVAVSVMEIPVPATIGFVTGLFRTNDGELVLVSVQLLCTCAAGIVGLF
jgi:hypothetical protein